MAHIHGKEHYMNGHIHAVLCHIVVCIFVQLLGMDPNGTFVGRYELHMEGVYRKVDHIKLLLNGKEPESQQTVQSITIKQERKLTL